MAAPFVDSERPIMFSADTCAEIPIFRPTPVQMKVSFHFPHAWDIHKYCAGKTELKIRFEDVETSLRVAQEARPQQWIKGTVLIDLTILTNGNPLSIPTVAANAVFLLQARKKSDTVKVLLRLKIENFHDLV
jgi:hypothetical protein